MSDIINILPDSVANQIAAGEVVDRPASAVKELLENALDAGARHIQLIVKDAGRTLIQVVDDGCGMSDSDARLCFERHATSKIHEAGDLFGLNTMGFRGEALASIASIAQVELRTRKAENELGTVVVIEGSHIQSQQPCSTAIGTSISVKNLFFNVPARRNFLKRDSIELGHIEETFKRIALAHCDIAFSMHSNGRPLYELQQSNLAKRITHLFGNNYKERLYYIEEQCDIVSLYGYVGKADYARRTRGDQYLYVNGRYIKHPYLGAAIEKSYADLIPADHHPAYFVMLNVDPSRIDVNIHPTKTEVRFIDESAIFAILRSAVKKALGQFSLDNQIEFNPCTEIDFTPAPEGYTPPMPQVHYNPNYNPFSSHASGSRNRQQWETFFDSAIPERDETILAATDTEDSAPVNELFPIDPETANESQTACMQVQRHWIVSALSSGLLVIDQQRAHERILFERLCAHNAPVATQQLLFPINCSFQPSDAEVLTELLPSLREQGFDLQPLGANSYVAVAVPHTSCEDNLQQLLEEIIADYKASLMQSTGDNRQTTLCSALARRMATKVGTVLTQEEMQQIVADLFRCQVPHTSPSGESCMTIVDPNQLLKK